LHDLDVEAPGLAGNFLNLRQSQQLDIQMPADLDQLG
jgi:hypothetical protein